MAGGAPHSTTKKKRKKKNTYSKSKTRVSAD